MSEHTVHHTNIEDTLMTILVGSVAGAVSKLADYPFVVQCAHAVFFAGLSYGTKLAIDWIRNQYNKRKNRPI